MIFGLGYNPENDARFIIEKLRDLEKTFYNKLVDQRGLYEKDLSEYFDSDKIIWKKKSIDTKARITSKNENKFWWKYEENEKFEFHILASLGFVFRCISFDMEGFEATLDYDKFHKSMEFGLREYQIDFMDRSKKESSNAKKLARKILDLDNQFIDNSKKHF